MAATLHIYHNRSMSSGSGNSATHTKYYTITVTADASTSSDDATLVISTQTIGLNGQPLNRSYTIPRLRFEKGTSTLLYYSREDIWGNSGSIVFDVTLSYGGIQIAATKSIDALAEPDSEFLAYTIYPDETNLIIGTSTLDVRFKGNQSLSYDILAGFSRISQYPNDHLTMATNIAKTATPLGILEATVSFDPNVIGPQIPTKLSFTTGTLTLVARQGTEIVGADSIDIYGSGSAARSLTFTMPSDSYPTLSTVTPSDTKGYRNTYGVYVGTKSILQASVSASGIYGSTITKVEHTIDELSVYTTDPSITKLIGTLNQSGSRILKTVITDSRGTTATKNTAITVVPYVAPTLTFQANRWDLVNNEASDGSNTVRLVGECVVPNVNNVIVEDNTLVFNWRLRGDATWQNVVNYMADGPNFTKTFDAANQSVDNQYEYQAVLTDAFGTTITIESSVGTATPVLEFHSSGKGVGIGTVAPEVGLDIGMQTTFKGTAEDGYSRIQITDPEGNDSVILANLAGSTLQLLMNALGDYDRALIGSHVFMQNNKAIGGVTTTGGETPILKMNPIDRVEFTWTQGGVRGRVGKQLWQGNAAPNATITVPELSYYNVFVIYDGGSRPGLAVRVSFSENNSILFGIASEPQPENIWLKAFQATPTGATSLKVNFFTHIDIKNGYSANAETLKGIRGLL